MTAPKKHSKISPSGAHRWMNCPGAPKLEAQFPDKDSVYSAEGTDAHNLFEHCIKEGRSAKTYLGKDLIREDGSLFQVNQEMVEAVEKCYVWCMEAFNSLQGATITAETKYELPFIHPDLAGTCDVTIRQPFGKLVIVDYKHGKGVQVEAFNNPQLMIYALGALGPLDKSGSEMYDIIDMVIWQPRTSDEPKIWSVTPKELRLWGEKTLKPAAEKAAKGSKSLIPGDWCQFCKAKQNLACPKLNTNAVDVFKDETNVPDVSKMTPEIIGEILGKFPLFDQWRKALEDKAFQTLLEGGEIPGFKLVEGRSDRTWKNEAEAQEILGRLIPFDFNLLFTQKFDTVAQAEKKLKKIGCQVALNTFYAELVTKPRGKPTIAPISDKREALRPDRASDLFKNEEGETNDE